MSARILYKNMRKWVVTRKTKLLKPFVPVKGDDGLFYCEITRFWGSKASEGSYYETTSFKRVLICHLKMVFI